MLTTTRRTIALALAALLAVAACGQGFSTSPSGAAAGSPGASGNGGGHGGGNGGGNGGAGAGGEISISGSSTVLPISQGMQELFNESNPDVAIRVDGPGTGDGFERFCNGETDISNASRAISEEEAQACADAGIEYVELQVAIDGLSILTNPANEGVTCVSYADLYALVGPEAEGIENWNDGEALAQELGSTTDLPDAALEVTGPGEESGTYDYFVEEVVGEFAEDRGQEEVTRKDYNSSGNDNVIVRGVTGSDTSLGWVGYAYAVENEGAVKLLDVSAPAGECTAPTPETIASNEYPLSRPLFIYVNNGKADENDALVRFVDFHLDPANLTSIVDETGYVNLDDGALQEASSAWQGR